MPKVTVETKVFEKLFLYKFSNLKELEVICFNYGMEVEYEEEQDAKTKEVKKNYVFETAANRPDLLSGEGIAQALNVYQQCSKTPVLTLIEPQQRQKIIVKKNTGTVRPYVVGCILRNITFTQESYDSFIDLQTKLHFNLCRRRRLVAIGTHNLDVIKGPFIYDAQKPTDFSFTYLNQTEVMTGAQVMESLKKDNNLKEFCPIIEDKEFYPVIFDSNGVVLSMPPLINGDHSKMSKDTKNVFIECTATDITRAIQALNVMIASFSQYCAKPFEVEPVDIEYEVPQPNMVTSTPDIQDKEFIISVEKVKKLGTFECNQEQVIKLLEKMQFKSEPHGAQQVKVFVPPFRSDILQECDIAEDVCIAHGYNNIVKTLPSAFTIGTQQILNKLSDLIREEIAAAGYQEGLNFALNSDADLTTKLCKKEDLNMVKIQNPRTTDFTCGRTTLIPGCLKWLSFNKVNKLPIQLFELSDVILKDSSKPVGARNERRICALYYNKSSQLEIIHGLLDLIMVKLNIPHQSGAQKDQKHYYLEPVESPTFFPERQAKIMFDNKEIGVMGILHPDVLAQYSLENPVSLIEINLEPLFAAFTEA